MQGWLSSAKNFASKKKNAGTNNFHTLSNNLNKSEACLPILTNRWQNKSIQQCGNSIEDNKPVRCLKQVHKAVWSLHYWRVLWTSKRNKKTPSSQIYFTIQIATLLPHINWHQQLCEGSLFWQCFGQTLKLVSLYMSGYVVLGKKPGSHTWYLFPIS